MGLFDFFKRKKEKEVSSEAPKSPNSMDFELIHLNENDDDFLEEYSLEIYGEGYDKTEQIILGKSNEDTIVNSQREDDNDDLNPIDQYENKEIIYAPSEKLTGKDFIEKLIKDIAKEERNSINEVVLNYLNREILKEDSPIYHYNPDFLGIHEIYKLVTLQKINKFERGRLTEEDLNEFIQPLKKGEIKAICKYNIDPFFGDDYSGEFTIGQEYTVIASVINHNEPSVFFKDDYNLWPAYLFEFKQNNKPFDIINDPINLFFKVKDLSDSEKYDSILPFSNRFDFDKIPYDYFKEPDRLDKKGGEYAIYLFNFIVKYIDSLELEKNIRSFNRISDYIFNREEIIIGLISLKK